MTFAGQLLLAYLIVFLMNLAPAFMPPTWSVLAFFLIRDDLPLLPLSVGGAIAASLGRLVLALASRRWGPRLVPARQREGLRELGEWLDRRARWTAPAAVLVYSFGPIPSNQLFIAAGLTRMRLGPLVGAFFVGRLISYTFWVYTAHRVSASLENIFLGYWGNLGALAVQLLVLGLLVAFTRIDWLRVVRRLQAGRGTR